MANCKSCKAEIIWIKTKNGKNTPIDAKPVRAHIKGVYPGASEYHPVDVHLSHWGSCPDAAKFKKGG